MTRRLALALMLPLAFVSPHLLAKTSTLAENDQVEAECAAGAAEEAPPSPKPATKRGAQIAPAKAKPQTTQFREQSSAKQAPRWHRFIPGMIR